MRYFDNSSKEMDVKKLMISGASIMTINHRPLTWQEEQSRFSHAKTGCSNRIRCMEAGCRACGNPAYPECKDSCPLYDD